MPYNTPCSFISNALTAFGQKGNIFSICCSIGEYLLDFLKVIIVANGWLTSFRDC